MKIKPKKSKDVYVTQAMFFEFRQELKELLKSSFHDLKSDIQEIRSEMHELRSEIHAVKAELHDVRSEIHVVKAEVAKNTAEIHRVGLLVEEQNARNILVLDGYEQIYRSQQDLASQMGHLEKEWSEFKAM